MEGDASSNNLATLNTYPTFQQEEEEEYPDYNIDDYDSEAGNMTVFSLLLRPFTWVLCQQQSSKNYKFYHVISLDSDDGEETICFYSESGDDDITCLPELENHGTFNLNYWIALWNFSISNINSDLW